VYPDIYEELSCGAVQIGQERIALTPKEAVVFHCLVRSQGELISREEILRAGWGEKLPDCKRVVDTVIKQLRGKLKETQYVIRSKYKLGYLLEKQ
jgi:DNA-binding response OmpR family regulator